MGLPSWIQNIPDESPGGLMGDARHAMQGFVRNQFMSSFAAGGMAAQAYGPTSRSRMAAVLSREARPGSPEWVRRMEGMKNTPGASSTAIDNMIADKRASYRPGREKLTKLGMMGKALGPIGFMAMPAIGVVTGEGAYGKAKGGLVGVADSTGFAIGMGVGRLAGAAIGGIGAVALGPIAIGMAAAYGASAIAEKGFEIAEGIVGRERKKRASEWGRSNPAFDTQRAYTMRQQSLSMMNRGQNTARSMMGREAVMIHQ